LGPAARKDLKDLLEQVQLAHRVHRDLKELQDHKDPRVLQDHKAPRVLQDHKARRAQQVPQVAHKVLPVQQAQQAHRVVRKGHKVHRDPRGQLVLQDHKAHKAQQE
jgi:hypothetical protein